MPTPELTQFAESLLDELMKQFPLKRRPTLEWRALRVTAGVAHYRDNRIGLSRNLLVNAERLKSTLVHEYAHLLAVERHGRPAANHGEAWKRAMVDLGAKPERTHCYEVERNETRQRVIYQCARCGKQILRARRLPKRRKYVHASCGGGLRLISVETTTKSQVKP